MDYIEAIREKTEINNKNLLNWLGISKSKYYYWRENDLVPEKDKSNIPRRHWLLDWERAAIIEYALKNRGEGYRRLTYMMLDEDVVAVSPSSVYRVLQRAGLLNKWNTVSKSKKGTGFHQPTSFNEHWHTDIKYVNYKGTFLFLITIFDGFSRYVVHHDLRLHMQETDIEIVLQGAIEKYPLARPKIISDNGRQYISKDFASYLRTLELQHIKTSIMYPQSNGKIERYHRNISSECLSKKSFINLEDARKQIAEYVKFYNTKRLHSALNYLTPEDYVMGRVDERIAEREQKLLMAKKLRYSVKNVC